MGVPQRTNRYIGLKDLDILIEDNQPDSQYFRVLECPTIFTQGKSRILLGGSPLLKPGIQVKIEILNDVTNEVIYNEPVKFHAPGNLIPVSVEIYSNTPIGASTIYIVGELDPNHPDNNVPEPYQGIYNVRWSKSIVIDGSSPNTQPIYFYKQPSISVTEIYRGFVDTITSSTQTAYLTASSGVVREGFEGYIPSVEETDSSWFGRTTYPKRDFDDKSKLSIIEENKLTTKLSGKIGHIGSKGKLLKLSSPAEPDYTVYISGSNTLLSSSYVGHEFTINNPQIPNSFEIDSTRHTVPSVYSSSVMKVLNDTSFVPKDPFLIQDTQQGEPYKLIPAPLTTQYITASYQDLPTQTTSSVNYFSFADIRLTDMRTFSGDVHKVKIYAKSGGTLGDFELIYDSPIESEEVLYDINDTIGLGNTGYFNSQGRINSYWEVFQGFGSGTTGTLTKDDTFLIDAMKISGSNRGSDNELRVQLKTSVNFTGGIPYTFKAKLFGVRTFKENTSELYTSQGSGSYQGKFKVHMSGSAFSNDTSVDSWKGPFKFQTPTFPENTNFYNFRTIEGTFIPDNDGNGVVQFIVPSGIWYVSDVSIKVASDTAFSPDFVRILTPVPPLRTRPDNINFLVEFYDVNNNSAGDYIFSDGIEFTGQNLTIEGDDNLLTGSLWVGSGQNYGFEMSGESSARLNTSGYSGFTSASAGSGSGIMMWSGSVLTSLTDDYSSGGMGMELVKDSSSYFRFKTKPTSELDIRTEKFFFGSDDQFISGYDGNIEISSSGFRLAPDGTATFSGSITASAGEIGGWKVETDKLVSINDKMLLSGSGEISASSGQFYVEIGRASCRERV